jgi:hypothetical protein
VYLAIAPSTCTSQISVQQKDLTAVVRVVIGECTERMSRNEADQCLFDQRRKEDEDHLCTPSALRVW